MFLVVLCAEDVAVPQLVHERRGREPHAVAEPRVVPHGLDDHELEVSLPEGLDLLLRHSLSRSEGVADGLLARITLENPLGSRRVHVGKVHPAIWRKTNQSAASVSSAFFCLDCSSSHTISLRKFVLLIVQINTRAMEIVRFLSP